MPDNNRNIIYTSYELTEDDIIKGCVDAQLEAEIAAEEYSDQVFDEGEKGYVQYTTEEWDWILSVLRTQDHSHKDWERVQLMIRDAMYPFCKYVARRYYRTYLPKYGDDLANEGYLGMLKALDTYDPRKGAPTTWCFREIIHADRDLIDLMEHHTSAHFWTNVMKIMKRIAEWEREGLSWDPDDLAIELNLSPTTIEGCMQIYKRNKDQVSIDAPVGDSDMTIGDKLVSDFPDPLQSVMESEHVDALHTAMRKYLDDKEYLAVYYAYGFEDNDPKSAPEIAKATANLAPKFRIRQQEVKRLLESARFKLERGLVIDRSMNDDINERSSTRRIVVKNVDSCESRISHEKSEQSTYAKKSHISLNQDNTATECVESSSQEYKKPDAKDGILSEDPEKKPTEGVKAKWRSDKEGAGYYSSFLNGTASGDSPPTKGQDVSDVDATRAISSALRDSFGSNVSGNRSWGGSPGFGPLERDMKNFDDTYAKERTETQQSKTSPSGVKEADRGSSDPQSDTDDVLTYVKGTIDRASGKSNGEGMLQVFEVFGTLNSNLQAIYDEIQENGESAARHSQEQDAHIAQVREQAEGEVLGAVSEAEDECMRSMGKNQEAVAVLSKEIRRIEGKLDTLAQKVDRMASLLEASMQERPEARHEYKTGVKEQPPVREKEDGPAAALGPQKASMAPNSQEAAQDITPNKQPDTVNLNYIRKYRWKYCRKLKRLRPRQRLKKVTTLNNRGP